MKKFAFIIALNTFACTTNDPRNAEVEVTDPLLREIAIEAIHHWEKATGGDVFWSVIDKCENNQLCVTLRFDSNQVDVPTVLTEHGAGVYSGARTNNHTDDFTMETNSIVRVNPDINQYGRLFVKSTVVHEFGHVILWSKWHTSEYGMSGNPGSEVMEPTGGFPGHACIGEKTLAEYRKTYGNGDYHVECW